MLTSLGILGTFVGIVAGLLHFDTNDIDASIGPLLAGLKTAFITSLVGIALSIIYKIMSATPLCNRSQRGQPDEAINITHLYLAITEQTAEIKQLHNAIQDETQDSLLAQFKLLRADLSDRARQQEKVFADAASTLTETVAALKTIEVIISDQGELFKSFEERLWIKFQDFSDMLSKSATEQVINALKEVIHDFNNNLIEQFGDNFKALNAAVEKLVLWQNQYKEQLSDMQHKYALGVEAISQSEVAVRHISHESRAIPESMQQLKGVLEVNQHQISELDRHLHAFSDVKDKAVAAVPKIQEQVETAVNSFANASGEMAGAISNSANDFKTLMTKSADDYQNCVDRTRVALTEAAQTTANSSEKIKKDFTDTVTEINNGVRNMMNEFKSGGKALNDNFKTAGATLIQESRSASEQFQKQFQAVQDALKAAVEQQTEAYRMQADRTFKGLSQTVEQAMQRTGQSVEKQMQTIDQATEREIEQVMTHMGTALGTIANQFTKDYSRLVQEMNKTVRRRQEVAY